MLIRRALSFIAIAFGFATLIAGARVLAGADPGYVAFRPLLLFNTVMGVVYMVTGLLIWRGTSAARVAAGSIFVVNLAVLAGIAYLYRADGAVARESLAAMSFRTAVWLLLFVGVVWDQRRVRRAAAVG